MIQHLHVAALIAVALISSLPSRADERPSGPPIYIRLSCYELDFAKLRKLGIEWDTVAAEASAEEMHKFVRLLAENGLALRRADPQIGTLAGRTANFEVGDPAASHTKLIVTPQLTEEKRIKLELDFSSSVPLPAEKPELPAGQRRIALSKATEVEPGKVACLVHPGLAKKGAEEEGSADVGVFVFVVADTKRPEFETARRPSPAAEPRPLPEYRER